jgi:hypothetical protein
MSSCAIAGYLALEESVPAYADFCTGIRRHAMVVEDVSFADGSKWQLKEPGKEKENWKIRLWSQSR